MNELKYIKYADKVDNQVVSHNLSDSCKKSKQKEKD